MVNCYCGSSRDFSECCEPIILGIPAPSAEALVRSRYSAFILRKLDHIQDTHAEEVKHDFNRAEAERLAEECQFLKLKIHKVRNLDSYAEVEFVVTFRHNEKTFSKGSLSKFRRDGNHWFYVSNKHIPHITNSRESKLGRNDPCSCGSGIKFKKCCLSSNQVSAHE